MNFKEIKFATPEEAVAALYATHLINSDNKAVVNVKGYGGDYVEYNAIFWSEHPEYFKDMEPDEIESTPVVFFSGWEDYQIRGDE